MKPILYTATIFALVSIFAGCKDDILFETSTSTEDFNIEAFSNGYSLAFDIKLDRMGGNTTRAEDITDADIEEWENHIKPEETRILFFDSQDRFLFESKSRWLTQIPSQDGGRRWRVGVPVFQYLSDGFDEHLSEYESSWVMDDAYNWERIAEIMRTEPFKVAILANRPSNITIPAISDLTADQRKVDKFGKNGPFWGPKNSVASYDNPDNSENKELIRNVFDLHHCQYDPFYENKNKEGGAYEFVMTYGDEMINDDDGTVSLKSVPHMGAVSGWLHSKRVKKYNVTSSTAKPPVRYYYKLPKAVKFQGSLVEDEDGKKPELEEQYIPMYGIQLFDALTDWKKGTTYYLSEQSGSQTGEYDYKSISLLRSVVKLELRIPKTTATGQPVEVDNDWAQICANNFMARCEPMDVSTPTDQIWKADHIKDCEWNDIRNHGLYAGTEKVDCKDQLSWFFGTWLDKENIGWNWNNAKPKNFASEKEGEKYPKIFNPITQRLQLAFITDCYLPTDDYHRWIVYCGERNMNDPHNTGDVTTTGYISTFRVQVGITSNRVTNYYIYHLPITDYSPSDNTKNPIEDFMCQEVTKDSEIREISSYPKYLDANEAANNYYKIVQNDKNNKHYPYPLLRNHHYRLTVSIGGNGDDVDVQVVDGEKRTVGGIEFN